MPECVSLGEDIACRSDSSTTLQALGHTTIERTPESYTVLPATYNHELEKGVMCMKTHSDSDHAAESADLKPSEKAL